MALETPSVTSSTHHISTASVYVNTKPEWRTAMQLVPTRNPRPSTIPSYLFWWACPSIWLTWGKWISYRIPSALLSKCSLQMDASCFISRYQTATLNSKGMIMDFQMALCHTKSIIFQHCYGFFKWNYIRMVACTPSLYSTVFIMIELLPVTPRLKKKKDRVQTKRGDSCSQADLLGAIWRVWGLNRMSQTDSVHSSGLEMDPSHCFSRGFQNAVH